MSIFKRCNDHGHFLPCVECVMQQGWEEHGGKGPMPAKFRDKASNMAGDTLNPVFVKQYHDNSTIPWTLESYGWRAVLNDSLDIQLHEPDSVRLTHYGAVLFMESVSGTEIEKKAAALALVTHFLTGLISKLAFVTG